MRRALLVGLVVLVAIQLVAVERDNGPGTVDAVQAPPEVTTLLRRACTNCHTGATEWPWYSRIAPASWWAQSEVLEGRRRLNFSQWDAYASDPDTIAHKLQQVAALVRTAAMAPWPYRLLHARARLTSAQRESLIRWATQEIPPRAPHPD